MWPNSVAHAAIWVIFWVLRNLPYMDCAGCAGQRGATTSTCQHHTFQNLDGESMQGKTRRRHQRGKRPWPGFLSLPPAQWVPQPPPPSLPHGSVATIFHRPPLPRPLLVCVLLQAECILLLSFLCSSSGGMQIGLQGLISPAFRVCMLVPVATIRTSTYKLCKGIVAKWILLRTSFLMMSMAVSGLSSSTLSAHGKPCACSLYHSCPPLNNHTMSGSIRRL